MAGLESLDAGTVVIDGVDVTNVPPRQRGIGFVFQHYAAFKHMTVRDNVAFGLTIRKRPKDSIRARVGDLLDLVGLAGLAGRYPDELSGGQRQHNDHAHPQHDHAHGQAARGRGGRDGRGHRVALV